MQLLLDTQLLLWAAAGSRHLSRKARELINDKESAPCFSVVSLWEVAIKNGLGRKHFNIDLPVLRRALLENDWQELAVRGNHILALEHLPYLHRDPFDRLLLAQSRAEGCLLVTADKLLGQYKSGVKLV